MIGTIPDVLARIVDHKRTELKEIESSREKLESLAEGFGPRRDFAAALACGVPAIIAEAKKASPSKGLLSADFDPTRIARAYESGGAAAMSVLTDVRFFQGSLADMQAARAAVKIPVLRKDFTISDLHVIQAAAHGADAILLIAAILTAAEMRRLRELAEHYGMAALVEVHDGVELDHALDSGARIVGVNNRNLHTFEVSLDTSLQLARRIPADCIRVSESGIFSAKDVRMVMDAGFQAFLVGEHLMKSGDPSRALQELREAA